jgi:hypothetical protein
MVLGYYVFTVVLLSISTVVLLILDEWSNEFLIVILHISLTELARMLCDQIDCNIFEIKNEITLRMRIRLGLTHYVSVSIHNNESVNLIFRSASDNGCIF